MSCVLVFVNQLKFTHSLTYILGETPLVQLAWLGIK